MKNGNTGIVVPPNRLKGVLNLEGEILVPLTIKGTGVCETLALVGFFVSFLTFILTIYKRPYPGWEVLEMIVKATFQVFFHRWSSYG